MRTAYTILVAAILAAGVGRPANVSAADEYPAQPAGIAAVQRQLYSPTPAQRIEALRRLVDFPPAEAVKLIVPLAVTEPGADVRRAAYETLLAWRNRPDVCSYLLRTLDKESHGKRRGNLFVPPLVAVLVSSDLPETEHDLNKSLETYLAASQDGASALVAVADEFGRQGDKQAVVSLRRMTRLRCVSSTFACRRAVVQALILIRLPEAVETLIELLSNADGEIRGDILRHLAEVSGEWHGRDAGAWRVWWKANGEGFQFSEKTAGTTASAPAPPGSPSYYGLPIYARRMVFVLDISGSMEGSRLTAAKRELNNAIGGLPNDAAFGIVVFNNRVRAWQRNLVTSTPTNKQAAGYFVYNLGAGGMTATYDAIDAAFRFDAEAIYLLTDGEPKGGKMADPAAILAAVKETNRSRRVSIYTIGVMPGAPGGPLDSFVKTLAGQNYGVYHRVEQ